MKMKKTWFGGLIGKLIAVLLIMNMLVSLQAYAEEFGFPILTGVRCPQM